MSQTCKAYWAIRHRETGRWYNGSDPFAIGAPGHWCPRRVDYTRWPTNILDYVWMSNEMGARQRAATLARSIADMRCIGLTINRAERATPGWFQRFREAAIALEIVEVREHTAFEVGKATRVDSIGTIQTALRREQDGGN